MGTAGADVEPRGSTLARGELVVWPAVVPLDDELSDPHAAATSPMGPERRPGTSATAS